MMNKIVEKKIKVVGTLGWTSMVIGLIRTNQTQNNWRYSMRRILLISLMLWSCTNAPNGAINVEKKADKLPLKGMYLLKDYKGTLHQYKQPIILHHQKDITMYCSLHRQWENIKAMWKHEQNLYDYIIINQRGF